MKNLKMKNPPKIRVQFSLLMLVMFACFDTQQAAAWVGSEGPPNLLSIPLTVRSNKDIVLVRFDAGKEGVKTVQQALTILGYYNGQIDGINGGRTVQAIRRFWNDAGLRGGASKSNLDTLTYVSFMVVENHLSMREALKNVPAAKSAVQLQLLGNREIDAGSYKNAESILRRVQREFERLWGVSSQFSIGNRQNIGRAVRRQGRLFEAESILQRTIELQLAALGDEHPDTLSSRVSLANVYVERGNITLAVDMYRNVLQAYVRILGPEDPRTIGTQGNFGAATSKLGNFPEAEKITRSTLNALTRLKKEQNSFEELDYMLSAAMLNLAEIVAAQGRYTEAEKIAHRSVQLAERTFGPDGLLTMQAKKTLADILSKLGHINESEILFRQVLEVQEHKIGSTNGTVALTMAALAEVLVKQDRHAEAEILAKKAMRIFLHTRPPWNPDALEMQFILAKAMWRNGDLIYASNSYANGFGYFDDYLAENPIITKQFIDDIKEPLTEYFDVLAKLHGFDKTSARKSFEAQSWWTFSKLEVTLNDLGTRLKAGRPQDADLLRNYQETREKLNALRSAYASSFDQPKGGDAARRNLSSQIAIYEPQLDRLRQEIERTLPEISNLLRPTAMTADEAQQFLSPGEGLVTYAATEDFLYAWFVTTEHIEWRRIEITRDVLGELVEQLRRGVDISLAPQTPPPAVDCAVVSGSSLLADRPFDKCAARQLYDLVLGGFDLTGIKHLIVVPDGPLETIPFSLLVTEKETDTDSGPVWLVEDRAISALPTTSSLRALRGAGSQTPSSAQKPFLGIAPGDFSGHGANSPLRVVPEELPGTVTEVRLLAQVLGVGDSGYVSGAAASESFVKTASLTDYRVLSFATHGLMSREADYWTGGNIKEPALVLAGTSVGEDGLLTATEAATLRLNTDWLLLSGCNTAAGDGEDAEGLSGLARAFFFAGAKTLLVSHWSIEDLSAQLLMTGLMENAASHPERSKAVSLRSAMLNVKNTLGYEHPFFWAPFELVGEGSHAGSLDLPVGDDYPSSDNTDLIMASLGSGTGNAIPPLRGTISKTGYGSSALLQEPGSKSTEAALSLDRQARAEIQRRLILLGFDPKGADGMFGRNTRSAMTGWQEERQLPTTGFLTESQLSLLNTESEIPLQEWLAEGNSLAPTPGRRSTKRKRKRCQSFGFFRVCSVK